MSRQSADAEMKAIRRVIDIVGKLEPAAQRRVLGYVGDRINDPPAQAELPIGITKQGLILTQVAAGPKQPSPYSEPKGSA